MIRQFTAGSLVLVAAMLLVTTPTNISAAEDAEAEFSANCPVSGAKAKEGQAADYKEGKVYFCCGKCKAAFGKDSSGHAVKANAQLVATGQYEQKKCPFSGGPMKTESEIGGVTVKFCCGNCKKKADGAEGDDQLAAIFGEKPFAKGFQKKVDEEG